MLDDAVEALTAQNIRGIEGLEVEAPTSAAVVGGGLGMARQSSATLANIGSQSRKVSSGNIPVNQLGSRSSSPISVASRSSGMVSPVQSPPIMGQLASHRLSGDANSNSNISPSPGLSPTSGVRPMIGQRVSTGPLLPGGWSTGFSPPTDVDHGQDSVPAFSPSSGVSFPTEEVCPYHPFLQLSSNNIYICISSETNQKTGLNPTSKPNPSPSNTIER